MVRRGTWRSMLALAAMVLLVLAAVPAAASAASRQTVVPTATREAAATLAEGAIGSPYHPGAAGPRRFDCSGLVTWAYRLAGAELPARSSFELVRHGRRVARAALRRGDLVWTWDRRFGHVGIYVGGNRYVHAPGRGRRVEVAPLPTGRGFVFAVRP